MIAKRRKKKKSIQGIFFPILVIFFVVSITALLLVSNFKIREKRKELLSQIETVKKEIQNLEKKNQEMKAGISESQTQDYLEKEAREKLGLKKPGEEVVAIKKIQTEEKPTEQKEEKSLWQKFLEFFQK